MNNIRNHNMLTKQASMFRTLLRLGRKSNVKPALRNPVGKTDIKPIDLSTSIPKSYHSHRQPFYTEEQARIADELGHTRFPTRAEFESINGPYRGSSSANDYAKEYEAAMKEYRRQRLMGMNPVMEEIDLSPQARTPKPRRRQTFDVPKAYHGGLDSIDRIGNVTFPLSMLMMGPTLMSYGDGDPYTSHR